MAEGLEVTIKYHGAKYNQVAFPASLSSEFAILKKDLAHLRVHSPSQKNVRRVNGSFILHWPTAGTSPHVAALADSLHMRWFKLCSDDPEALKLREFLSIESITMVQDGVVIRSTAGAGQASQDAPQGTLVERLGDPSVQIVQQPTSPSVSTLSPSVKQPPPLAPPPRVPPTAPRSDRQQAPPLKRRMSSADGPSSNTRQKLDVPEVSTTTPLESTTTEPQSIPPETDQQRELGDATKASAQPTQDDTAPSTKVYTPTATEPPEGSKQKTTPSPPREPGEMISRSTPNPAPGPSSARPGTGPTSRPPPPNHRASSPPARPASPYESSPSSNNDDLYASRRRDRDVNRLTRELWDTRRNLTAILAREQVILDDLERLGARPEGTSGADRNGVSRDELARLEDDLRAEKARRGRAERALSDVERECRAPFVVPALFQAFMSISDLSS